MLDEEDACMDPKGEQMKTKNEIKPQKFDKCESDAERLARYGVHFKGNETLVEIGQIMSIVDDKIIIATNVMISQIHSIYSFPNESFYNEFFSYDGIQNESKEENSRIVMDLDNLIFSGDRKVVGTVDDVFGNIKNPFYSILVDKYLEELIQKQVFPIKEKMYMIEGFNKILM